MLLHETLLHTARQTHSSRKIRSARCKTPALAALLYIAPQYRHGSCSKVQPLRANEPEEPHKQKMMMISRQRPPAQSVMHAPLTACICRAPVRRFAEAKATAARKLSFRCSASSAAGCGLVVPCAQVENGRNSQTIASLPSMFVRGCAVLTS
jgi:hypothetical protein